MLCVFVCVVEADWPTNPPVCACRGALYLTDRLLEEQEQARTKQEEADKLRSESINGPRTSWRVALSLQLTWHG